MSSYSHNTNYANRNKNSTRRRTSRSSTPEDRSQKSRVKERETHDKRRNRGKRSRTSSIEEEEKEFSKILDRKRLEKILKEKDEKRRLKEIETPDEKRARRLAKKLQKEERRRTETINAFPEGIPYTDMNNPFNDTNLTETFIWKKKWESEGKGNVSTKKAEKVNREIIAKNFAEMEQLKRNRETREAAREDMEMIARDQERRQCDWNRTEDVFHLKQAKLRSSIRIKEGRAKPIDFLARYISYADESCQDVFELDNPLTYFPKDSIDDFEDLIADVQVYRVIDGQKNKFYWDDIETFAKNGLKRLLEARKRSTDTGTVHLSVQEEVLKIFKGKTYDELEQLESQIGAKISNASRSWQSNNIREEQMNQNANDSDGEDEPKIEEKKEDAIEKPTISDFEAKKEQKMSPEKAKYDEKQIPQEAATTTIPFAIQEFFEADDEQRDQMYQQVEANNSLEHFTTVLYECGRYSPAFGSKSQTMPGIEILDVAEDVKKLDGSRLTRHKKEGTEELTAKDQRMMEIAKQGMNQDEAVFSVEEKLDKQNFLWSDKYRPRKPRYFNRVHTGFDWNKYNQTHYDIDNPPPKIVQGYRFNIFYPDLLDSTQTPTFTLIKCDVPDFSILRFCAGPPYEDIAFKIVNREWEVNYKHGYKCQWTIKVFSLFPFATILFSSYGRSYVFVRNCCRFSNHPKDTEIDWATYMQHVEVYENGQRNYTEIRGDTGPIVDCFFGYPAGHLHIYRLFYHLTDHGKNIRCAQYIFGVVYLANLLLVFRLYFHSGKIPPFVLPLVCLTSYRVHSIFVLRLFNDPIAMLFFFVSLNLFISRCWLFGCVFFSFAVAVKMNILLFAPALFLVLLLSNGFIETFWLLAIAALIQVLVALEFLSFDCVAYLSRAFELSRVFLFEWTVNWRFIPEAVFVDRRFHIALLAAHLSLLAVFALKFWFRSSGGLFNSLRKLLFGVRLRLDAHDILFALFSSNLVGMAFARSLHYQFYCWYYHSIPYLLFSPLYSPNNQIAHIRDGKKLTFSSKQIAVRLAIMLGIEFCWNVFPSTSASSLLLHALHASVIVLSCRSPTSAHSPLKRG
uniref:dolichyl-P-Man:Man5GlcNAc2-PP-dolichol alpha-1,3-mannosyltransferase n=1 Tax=Globodera rostochiensis TaxID=31243 RepID=A0A914HK99_GLORO